MWWTYKVWQSVASPEIPMRHFSFTLKTLWKLLSIVISCVESLVSVAIATQFLPAIAIMEFPLYSSYIARKCYPRILLGRLASSWLFVR